MKLVVLADFEAVPDEDPDLNGRNRKVREIMEYHVADGLRKLGHEVAVLAFGPDIVKNIEAIREARPDLVFNLTESVEGDRRKDLHVTALLELLRIPYTGTGPVGLAICRDKDTCKRILAHHRVRLPHFLSIEPGRKRLPGRMVYPAIVKPLYEDGSDGISRASMVADEKELIERVRMIHDQMKQPAICEEFIEGREVYVGMVGNERLQVLPAREITFGRVEEGGPSIATARVKWDEAYRKKWQIEYRRAELEADLARRVARISRRVYRLLQIRDYGRIDFRIKPDGEAVFLEANPNPNLANDDEVAEAAMDAGVEYPQLLDRIIRLAQKRGAGRP